MVSPLIQGDALIHEYSPMDDAEFDAYLDIQEDGDIIEFIPFDYELTKLFNQQLFT